MTYYQRKTIQITVYAVKPRRRTKHTNNTHEQLSGHRHHRHQPPIAGAFYDRKAQLLHYSRELRAKAWLEKSSSHKPQSQHKVKEFLQITSIHKVIQPSKKSEKDLQITSSQNPRKVVPVENKPSQAKLPKPPPSCFGDWTNIFLPSFCMRDTNEHRKAKKTKKKNSKRITVSISEKVNAIMMSSRMEKERIGVMAKFLSTMRRR